MRRSAILWRTGKFQYLVDSILECDQISCLEFSTGTSEFMPVADFEEFRQTFVGIKAHAIPIGNSNQYQVEKLFQPG